MRKNKLLFVLATAALLVSCGQTSSSSSSSLSSSEDSATSDTTSSDHPNPGPYVVAEKDAVGLFGNYIGKAGKLAISGPSARLSKDGQDTLFAPYATRVITLENDAGTKAEAQAYYAKADGKSYRFFLDPFAGYLVMEKRGLLGWSGSGEVMLPIIEKAAGRYGYKDFIDTAAAGFTFDNTYDEDAELFQVTLSSSSFVLHDSFAQTYKRVEKNAAGERSAVSGFRIVDNEGEILEAGDFAFYPDRVDVVNKNEAGEVKVSLSSDIGFLQGSYYDVEAKESLRFEITDEGMDENDNYRPGKISFEGGDGVSYSKKIEDDGLHVAFTVNGVAYDAAPGVYGLTLNSKGKTSYLPHDSLDELKGTYDHKLASFSFENDEVRFNGQTVSYEKRLSGKRLGIGFETEGKQALFAPYIAGTAVRGTIGEENAVYLNNAKFISYYQGEFSCRRNNALANLSIDASLAFSSDDAAFGSGQGYLSFDPATRAVSYVLGETGYVYVPLVEKELYLLSKGKEMIAFTAAAALSSLYDDYTSHHEIELTLDREKLVLDGKHYGYDLSIVRDGNNAYRLFLVTQGDDLLARPDAHALYRYDSAGRRKGSYISHASWLSFGGNYLLQGKYGEEGFYIDAANGVFEADTVVKKEDGSFDHFEKKAYRYDLESLYNPADKSTHPVIAWHVPSTSGSSAQVYGYQYPGSFVVFGAHYTKERLFRSYGLYADASSNVVYLHDNLIAVNGASSAIKAYQEIEGGYAISNASHSMDYAGEAITLNGSKLTKDATFDIKKLVGVYKTADEKHSLEIKANEDPIMFNTTYQVYAEGSAMGREIAFSRRGTAIALVYDIIGGKLVLTRQDNLTDWVLTYEEATLPPPPPLG